MADEFMKNFGAGFDPLRAHREQVEAARAAETRQRQHMEDASRQLAEAQGREARRQEERDALQRQLVELQRSTAERDRQRDEQEAAREASRVAADDERDRLERNRKRRELYRWCFTTAIAIAALVVAIIGLTTRN